VRKRETEKRQRDRKRKIDLSEYSLEDFKARESDRQASLSGGCEMIWNEHLVPWGQWMGSTASHLGTSRNGLTVQVHLCELSLEG
jgi:hypothetical protein